MSDEPPRVRLSELEALATTWEQQGDEACAAEGKAMMNKQRSAEEKAGEQARIYWSCAEKLRAVIASELEVGIRVTYFAGASLELPNRAGTWRWELVMRERDQPSSLDDPTLEDGFPVRHVILFCDRCGTEIEADIRADTAEQAYEGVRRLAVAECGWRVTDVEDLCPSEVS